MQELEAGEEQCPHCGRELAGRNPSGSLPAGTVLAGRYTVGDIQSVDGEGILYRGVENNGPFRVTIMYLNMAQLYHSRTLKYHIHHLLQIGYLHFVEMTAVRVAAYRWPR